MNPNIFKSYDIRGVYPEEINEDAVYRIAQSYAEFIQPKKVALGKDARLSSPSLWQSAADGLRQAGVDVVDIGDVSTDMMYFAVAKYNLDGGIAITASHNPREYNGMKLVKKSAVPISSDSGLYQIRDLVLQNKNIKTNTLGVLESADISDDYARHCLKFISPSDIKHFSVVANANFGFAGRVFDRIKEVGNLPLQIFPLNYQPDGNFPKGRPDPLVPENRTETENLIKEKNADFGVAWDADADRCFFFDERGGFIDGYYIVALLSSILLRNTSGEKVIIDPRMVFATREAILENKGVPLINKVGHTFIKERMRQEDAVFAGENSAHLYFRDNFYCDNGMIPLLLIAQELSSSGRSLSELVAKWRDRIFVSGEINFKLEKTTSAHILEQIKSSFPKGKIDLTDGLSIEYEDLRFNLRSSNTEPLLRLNIESYSRFKLDETQLKIKEIINNFTNQDAL